VAHCVPDGAGAGIWGAGEWRRVADVPLLLVSVELNGLSLLSDATSLELELDNVWTRDTLVFFVFGLRFGKISTQKSNSGKRPTEESKYSAFLLALFPTSEGLDCSVIPSLPCGFSQCCFSFPGEDFTGTSLPEWKERGKMGGHCDHGSV
jgi:hypothetical protein